jgi:hypothetical protein
VTVLFAVFIGIFAVSVGHAFVADDFLWILASRVSVLPSLGR